MIRVNLIGGPKKAAGQAKPRRQAKPPEKANLFTVLWIAILLAGAVYAYLSWSGLRRESATLDVEIAEAQAEEARLQAVIALDEVFEERKAMLEARIDAIEDLQRNQVSPVVSLDMLSEAVDNTEFVWLTQLVQSNTSFQLSGVGTEVNAIASFIENLQATGHFRNINLVNAQTPNAAGNYTFQMTCEFVPPELNSGSVPSAAALGPN